MTAREEALQRIAAIAREHELETADIAAALAGAEKPAAGELSAATRLLSFLGGIFVLAGLGVFIEMRWEAMPSIARVAVTLVPGIAAFAAAFLAAGDSRREKMADTLFLLGALLQPAGILTAISEYGGGGDERYAILLAAGVMFVQQLAAFFKLQRGLLLFLTLIAAVCICEVSMDLAGYGQDTIAFVLGLSILPVSRSIERMGHAISVHLWYFAGSAAMLTGLFSLLEGSAVEILFLGAACAVVFFSIRVRSRAPLAVGTIAILGYVGYYTAEHFSDVVGWPLALIAFGALLLGLGAAAWRIDRKYISSA